jgi:hypothetical protein
MAKVGRSVISLFLSPYKHIHEGAIVIFSIRDNIYLWMLHYKGSAVLGWTCNPVVHWRFGLMHYFHLRSRRMNQASIWFFLAAWLSLRPLRWKQHVAPKRRWPYPTTRLESCKIMLFIVTEVRTSKLKICIVDLFPVSAVWLIVRRSCS